MFEGIIPTIVAAIGLPILGFLLLVIVFSLLVSFAIAGTAYLVIYLIARFWPLTKRPSGRDSGVYTEPPASPSSPPKLSTDWEGIPFWKKKKED